MPSRIETLRASLLAGKRLIGLFTRLSDSEAVAALAASRLDFVVLDVEHGSLSRQDIDRVVAAGLARDLPVVVRLPDATPAAMHHAIAVGAAGIIVSHITSAEEAEAVATFARTAALERAFAGMSRPTDYRRTPWPEFRTVSQKRLVVIAQIDELAGMNAADRIAAVQGIDAIFMGSLSLALALGASQPSERVVEQALVRICAACQSIDKRIGMHLQDPKTEASWSNRGVNLYVAGNDLSLLLDGAERAVARFHTADAGA